MQIKRMKPSGRVGLGWGVRGGDREREGGNDASGEVRIGRGSRPLQNRELTKKVMKRWDIHI